VAEGAKIYRDFTFTPAHVLKSSVYLSRIAHTRKQSMLKIFGVPSTAPHFFVLLVRLLGYQV